KGKPRPEFNITLWVDDSGQILKSSQDILGGLLTYRTTEAGANAPDNATRVDSILQSVLKVRNKISNSGDRHDIRYEISFKADNPAEVIPTDRRQTLEKGNAATSAILEVRAPGPNDGEASREQPDAAFERPNALITSADRVVKSLAREAVGRSEDP